MHAMNMQDESTRIQIRRGLQRWLATSERPISVIIGTRAQLIKMAPLLREFERREMDFDLVFTGQHQLTMQELLNEFNISTQPFHLFPKLEVSGVLAMSTWLPRVVAKMIRLRKQIFRASDGAPKLAFVHGDTMSTLAGAIAARIVGSPVAHVEAGLRSYRLADPFPEELTRIIVSRGADIHFCPGTLAFQNICARRGIRVNTGQNTLLDSLRYAESSASEVPEPQPREPYCVVSIHRFENIYSRWRLEWLSKEIQNLCTRVNVEFVLHPATAKRLEAYQLRKDLESLSALRFRPRMTYVPFIQLLSGARFVLTDGGSNQEELHYLGKPTLLMRSATERPEGLGEVGKLCDFKSEILTEFVEFAMSDQGWRGTIEALSPSVIIADCVLQQDATSE